MLSCTSTSPCSYHFCRGPVTDAITPPSKYLANATRSFRSNRRPPTQSNPHPTRPNLLGKVARDVAKLALLQLRLPEHRVGVRKPVLLPARLLDVVQVDEATR